MEHREERVDEEVIEENFEEEQEVLKEPTEAEEPKEDEALRWKEQAARLQADFTNYRRRVEEEKKTFVSLGVKKIALDILGVMDNLERAVDASGDASLDEGVGLIAKQMKDVLARHEIVEMEAEGMAFDPMKHHAVLVESVEGKDPDQVIDVLQKGYMIGDEVLRPAMVKVSQ